MRKSFVMLTAAVILTAGAAAAPPPQCTLPPPQDMLAFGGHCRCIEGGKCTCTAVCSCGDNCTCGSCPGKRPEGVALDLDDAVRSCRKYACPLVAFVHQPARPIRGCIAYRADPSANPEKRVYVGTPAGGIYLPGDARDSSILIAANPGRPVVRYEQSCNETGCKLLPIFGQPPIVNAALMAPPMYSFGSFGGGCSGGR